MKYSVTIPAYKAQFLKEAIDSILAQTICDFEVIILDDASPENIDEIVSSYADSRIRYYKNEKNVGAVDVVDNWNKLLELSNGEFFICMGDDDKLAPNCLEEYGKLMEKHPGLAVYHARTMMIDENSKFCDLQEERPEWQSVYSLIWHYTFKEGIQFVGDFLYETTSLRERGGFYKLPMAWGSDCVTSFIAASERGIANTQVPIFFYRTNRFSITKSSNQRIKIQATKMYQDWMNNFTKLVPDNNMDKKYWKLIREGFDGKIKHHEIFMVANDVRDCLLSSVWYWLKNRKTYGLTIKDIFLSVGIGIALKLK